MVDIERIPGVWEVRASVGVWVVLAGSEAEAIETARVTTFRDYPEGWVGWEEYGHTRDQVTATEHTLTGAPRVITEHYG